MLKKCLSEKSELLSFLKEVDSGKSASVFGASFGEKSLMINAVSGLKVFVALNEADALSMATNLGKLGEKVCLYYGESGINIASKIKDKLIFLSNLLTCKATSVVITKTALTETYPSPRDVMDIITKLSVGQNINFKGLISALVRQGYKTTSAVSQQGEISYRGDILDIFGVGEKLPVRLSFWGDEIESIKRFNKDTYDTINDEKEITILGANLNLDVTEKQVRESFDNHKIYSLTSDAKDRLEQIKGEVLREVELGSVPYYYHAMVNSGMRFTCFLPSDATIFIDNPKRLIESISDENKILVKQYNLLLSRGEITHSHKPYFNIISNYFAGLKCVGFQNLVNSNPLFNAEVFYQFKSVSSDNFYGNTNSILNDVKHYSENGYTIILCLKNDFSAINYEGILTKSGYKVNLISSQIGIKKSAINILPLSINFSSVIQDEKLAILGLSKIENKPKSVKTFTKEEMPTKGDYVVHSVHGVGLCEGTQKLKLTSEEKDYIVVSYAGGDKLFVPCENADLISKFKGGDVKPKLNKMGGQDFEKVKNKVRASVKQMAFDLAALYKERQNLKGFKYKKDEGLETMFKASFPHEETPAQTTAIKDIFADMEQGRVMDRLICGDVGFGKTEVALRAIFKAVISGKQVAFLAPTTILSTQHYNTCKTRLSQFGIEVGLLNRFRTKKEQEQTLADLASGKCNVVCGTHRLLSSDVKFENLGLLVLDEEQRFGVNQKEKLKTLRKNLDVLTLSATPIPRTLHMSLINVRDISIIDTPPEGRLPVQTYVIEYSDGVILSAIEKELARGGQVLMVYNRVEGIYDFASRVQNLVGSDVPIDVAHAQMDARTLEGKIEKLYAGQTKIFISTTIIENGVDLPNANTIIVCNANTLGLSQLYQLRGRVGRSDKLAYAYFTYFGSLTDDAFKRLDAINEFTSLGSGYKIAMRDLEIRGAGSVLGAEQHGHMEKVGYDMYVKLLNEAVSEAKGEKVKEEKEVLIDVNIPAVIPEDYVKLTEERIDLYKKLGEAETKEAQEKTLKEIAEKYGEVPVEVKNLADIIYIKNLAREAGVKRLVVNQNACSIYFYKENFNLSPSFTKVLGDFEYKAVLSFEAVPVVKIDLKTMPTRQKLAVLEKLFILLKQLI